MNGGRKFSEIKVQNMSSNIRNRLKLVGCSPFDAILYCWNQEDVHNIMAWIWIAVWSSCIAAMIVDYDVAFVKIISFSRTKFELKLRLKI